MYETEPGVNTVDGHGVDVKMAGATFRGRKAKTWDAVVGMEYLAAGLKIPRPVHSPSIPAAAEHACQPDGDVIRCFTSAWRIEMSIENLEFVRARGGFGQERTLLRCRPPLPSVPRKSEPALSSKTAAAMRKRKKAKNIWMFSVFDQLGQARMPKKKEDGHKKRTRACGHV